jgi:hypothetical protein
VITPTRAKNGEKVCEGVTLLEVPLLKEVELFSKPKALPCAGLFA